MQGGRSREARSANARPGRSGAEGNRGFGGGTPKHLPVFDALSLAAALPTATVSRRYRSNRALDAIAGQASGCVSEPKATGGLGVEPPVFSRFAFFVATCGRQ